MAASTRPLGNAASVQKERWLENQRPSPAPSDKFLSQSSRAWEARHAGPCGRGMAQASYIYC
jgi:hypothetical protein